MSIIDKYPVRTSTFPIEILDLIFEQLYFNEDPHEQNIASLKNMSLVCKAFVPIARRYIFRRIKLNTHQPSMGSEALCALPLARLLHKQPDISRFIRTLCLYDTRILADGQDDEPSTFWYSNGAVAPLYNLPRLSYLKIHLNSPRSYLKASPYGGLSFRRVLNHYICFDTLAVLNFWNVNDLPFEVILSAPSLTSLWISSCQMAPWVPPITGVKAYPLEMLYFHDSKHLPLRLLLCFPNLKEYVTGEKLWDIPKSQFLKRGEEWPFPSLETLSLSSKHLGWFGQVILGVQQAEADPFPRLRALEYGTDWEWEQIESFVDEVKTIEDLTVRMEYTFHHSMVIFPKYSSLLRIKHLTMAWASGMTSDFELCNIAMKELLSRLEDLGQLGRSPLLSLRIEMTALMRQDTKRCCCRTNSRIIRNLRRLDDVLCGNPTTFPALKWVGFSLKLDQSHSKEKIPESECAEIVETALRKAVAALPKLHASRPRVDVQVDVCSI